MPLPSLHQAVVGLSVRSDLPEQTVSDLFSAISFTNDRAVVHDGDVYRTYSPTDDTLLSSVHRLFGGEISISELDRRIAAAQRDALCCSEMSHGTLVELSARSSEADLSNLAALACASLSHQIVEACRELLLALKTLIVNHHQFIAQQKTVETSLFIRNGRDLVLVSARFAYSQRRRSFFSFFCGCSSETVHCQLDVRRIRIMQVAFQSDVLSGSPLVRRILPPSPPADARASSAPAKLSSRAEGRRILTPEQVSPHNALPQWPDVI